MKNILFVLIILLIFPIDGAANLEVTEEKVRNIYHELYAAEKILDYSVLKKYTSRTAEISVDFGSGQDEIKYSYTDYFKAAEVHKKGIEIVNFNQEIISLVVNETTNRVTIKSRATSTFVKDDSIFDAEGLNTVIYGVIDNEIKIISIHSKVIGFKAQYIHET